MAADTPEEHSLGSDRQVNAGTGAEERYAERLTADGTAIGCEKPGEAVEAETGKAGLEREAVEMAGFQPLRGLERGESSANYGIILDVEMDVTVELGRTSMRVKDVLSLTEGSVIELDKVVGEPVEIFANDRLIAYGEVVVIDEDFGVRINEIVSKGRLEGDEQ